MHALINKTLKKRRKGRNISYHFNQQFIWLCLQVQGQTTESHGNIRVGHFTMGSQQVSSEGKVKANHWGSGTFHPKALLRACAGPAVACLVSPLKSTLPPPGDRTNGCRGHLLHGQHCQPRSMALPEHHRHGGWTQPVKLTNA